MGGDLGKIGTLQTKKICIRVPDAPLYLWTVPPKFVKNVEESF